MAYMALYRQWRPQNFETLVGQQAVKKTLTNALNTGRIAHAYLFTGPRGTGKTSTARILAKALNCEYGPTANPCGHCLNCERITAGTSMDVFEIDAASNRGIEEIKALREQLAFTPVDGRYKIYIIDEVHMLTTEAFNALLKTLEEPPAHVIFILATTDPHKIPATIHSRCQRFDFHRVTVDEITKHLAMVAEQSGIQADEEALRLIAIQSEGGMRDALSLLDQCGVMSQHVDVQAVREVLGIVGREALRDLVHCIGQQDVSASLAKLQLLLEQGKDVKQVLVEIAEYLRALLLYKAAPSYSEVYLVDTAEALSANAEFFGQERLLAAEERLHAALQELKGTMRPRITAELCLLDLCRQEGSTLAALAARVEQLERQVAQGVKVQYTAPVQTQASPSQQAVVEAAVPVQPGTAVAATKQSLSVATNATQAAMGASSKQVAVNKTGSSKPTVKQSPQQSNPATMSAAPAAYEAKSAAFVATEDTGDVPTGEEYWQHALEQLKAEKKNAMVSCAKAGRVVTFKNCLLEVTFKSAFQCDRMNKDDYRTAFEDVLLRQNRLAIKLHCVVAGKAKPAPVVPNVDVKKIVQSVVQTTQNIKQPEPQVQIAATEVLPKNLQKVTQVLGGSIQKL